MTIPTTIDEVAAMLGISSDDLIAECKTKMSDKPLCPECEREIQSGADMYNHSGVSANNGVGFVHWAYGDQRKQMSVREARDYAMVLLRMAEAAESDAIVFRLLRERVGLADEHAARVIGDLRQFRDEHFSKDPT